MALGMGCATAAHETERRTTGTYLAQAADACRPGDPSTVCCFKKFKSAEACGMTRSEAATLMQGARELERATGTDATDDPDEGWRQHCIDSYARCQSTKKPRWGGPCGACMDQCTGQHQWPFDMCGPKVMPE
ncbi:hypothetical protein D7V88_23100 [Corallococcus terminator]|uniref:Uncharacterized protein n=1 Tax=Corallococcus terminator TaxID=2316733 RepID=A0A3A8J326_9BACT|nr:hypothetical protein D7V88_23100 [Corallococcus terminator]